MNTAELMKKIAGYGADESGINDRFMGNMELYERCFLDFMEEPSFELLRHAMAQKDYGQAFSAAHAIKGVAGNLGLTAMYDAVCALVEALRSQNHGETDRLYAEVVRQHTLLKRLLSDEGTGETDGDVTHTESRRSVPFKRICVLTAGLLAVLAGAALLFCRFFAG